MSIAENDCWSDFGGKACESFEFLYLTPKALADNLAAYRKVLGKDFSLQDLLKIQDIRAKTFIAEAITNVPELLIGHELVKLLNDPGYDCVSHGLSDVADAIRDVDRSLYYGASCLEEGLCSKELSDFDPEMKASYRDSLVQVLTKQGAEGSIQRINDRFVRVCLQNKVSAEAAAATLRRGEGR